MDKRELLAEFRTQLDEFDKFQTFIEKASASTKFSAAVVAKVVADNTTKIDAVVAALQPRVGDLNSLIKTLTTDREGVSGSTGVARLGLEELELRKEIGEIDDKQFEAESAGFRGDIELATLRLQEIDSDLVDLQATLDRWTAARPDADTQATATVEVSLEEAVEPVAVVDDLDEDPLMDDEDDAFADVGRGSGLHAERVSVKEDVSVVFETPADDAEALEGEDEDLGGGLAFGEDELGDLGDDLASDVGASTVKADAVLIQNEGTRDEIVYQFANDIISLGRGRDNTVQVKNDSKVSRYHCKVFRRDGAYFVEDNKSANGTLVEGELITEKRVLGGEELVVGETFFRFRIRG